MASYLAEFVGGAVIEVGAKIFRISVSPRLLPHTPAPTPMTLQKQLIVHK
jgi:hypothetical protein